LDIKNIKISMEVGKGFEISVWWNKKWYNKLHNIYFLKININITIYYCHKLEIKIGYEIKE